jgi:penicillin-binding protein 1A
MAKQAKNKPARKTLQDPIKRHIKTFWMIFGGGVLLMFLVFLLASWGIFGKLPDISEYENPEKNLATQVISEDGKVIGKFFKENRTPVEFEDLPDHLVNALIATEDVRFYDHAGIDGKGSVRAFAFLGTKGGASTISQQLAKQFFTDGVSRNKLSRATQKIKEWVIATKLESRYTKEEIITMYFNVYDFLNLAIGIESASNIYFNKSPQELSIHESAMLVGMFKNSSLYNPLRNEEGVTNRRNVVIGQMAKYDYITEQAKDSLQKLPLGINYSPQQHYEGIGTYVREYIRGYMKQWSKDNPKPNGTFYNIDSDGLKVYTTINAKMQRYAEEAVDDHMANLQKEFDVQNKKNKTAPFQDITQEEINTIMNAAIRRSDRWREMKKQGKSETEILESFKKKTKMSIFSWTAKNNSIDTLMTPMDSIRYYKSFFRASMMSMTPQTGEIKAWVGGVNYKNFKYDMVKKGKRQIGSTFKPFVYATAIDQMHMSPCDTLPNTPFCIAEGKYGLLKEWCPKNSSGNYGGMVTLRAALAQSINTVTARLIDRVGPRPVIDLVAKMGVDTKDIPEVPSIALGTADISLYEMVGAYSTFANEGVYVKPILVQRIEDKNGTILFQNVPETKDVISNETAYVTVSLLQGVTQSGSGSRLRHKWRGEDPVYRKIITGYPYSFENPIAGKTGTTQNNSDGWFMGMVPNLATGVWVGGDDRATHFSSTAYGQGASMALPIWGLFMKKCYADETLDVSKNNFIKPGKISIETNCDDYKKQNKGNGNEIPDDEFDF